MCYTSLKIHTHEVGLSSALIVATLVIKLGSKGARRRCEHCTMHVVLQEQDAAEFQGRGVGTVNSGLRDTKATDTIVNLESRVVSKSVCLAI